MNSIAPVFSEGRKLDDWLSPILVKELRQGMRSRVFVGSFLMIQVFLFLLVLANVAAEDDRNALDVQSHFFWIIVGFALLVLMPLRGLVTVSTEVKSKTLETIMLTRLTAWRVVFGKWSALFAQSLLFVTAVLPYVVLRYFIGGDDVISDFLWMLSMLWLSGVLISVSIAVSGLTSAVLRVVVLVGTIVLMTTFSDYGMVSATRIGSPLEILGWLLLFGFFIPALLFQLTASGIAPAAENHAIARRLLCLLFFICTSGLAWAFRSNLTAGIVIPFIVLVGVCYFDLSEKPRLLPRMVAPLALRGWGGKLAGLFFLPGWPSALIFSLVAIPLATITIYCLVPSSGLDNHLAGLVLIFAILGSVLPPAFICHFFWPKMNQVLLIIFLYNVILLVFASLLEGLLGLARHSFHLQIGKIFAFLPSLPVLYISENAAPQTLQELELTYLIGNGIVITFSVFLLFLGSRAYYRELFGLYRGTSKRQSIPDRRIPDGTSP